ncbi:TPA: phage tail protein [Escherichia coli]|nr:phage tail protein [Escherichia coli]
MSTTTRKFKTVITDTGAKKLAQAAAPDGKPVRLTHMAVGDGGGTLPTPDSKQTRLVHEVWRHTVNRVILDATHQNRIIAELVIPPETGGFWIREIGVFDEHGDLIAVGNTAESYKPTVAEGSGRAQTFRTILTVSSTATVALTVDNTMVMATVDYVDDKLKEHEQSRRHPDASLTAKGFVQLSSATNSTSETLAATSKAVKAVMDETNKKAPLNSPALTGTPTTPTARQGTNNTQIASTAFVMAAIAALVDSSPDALNTLNELAAALGNDPNFATTMTNALAGKQPKDATLTALAGLATAADKFPYFTGNDVASLATLTKVGRDILAKSTVAAVIEYLGLQETVNKAGNAVQKTGDTLSGGLTFENDSILAWIRNTDWAKIGFKNDADSDTDSYMWFETGDNGNEYFKWRSKQSTTTKDLMTLKWDALNILVNAVINGSVGIGTTNALGGSSIVLGDNDTGFKQNGDGILDVYANGAHVFRFINGNNESVRSLVVHGNCHATGALVAGNGSAQVAPDGNVYGTLWGGWLNEWLNNNVVKDIRLGSIESVAAWNGPGYYDSWGYVLTGAINSNRDAFIDTLTRRPLQKFIGGKWYTVRSI